MNFIKRATLYLFLFASLPQIHAVDWDSVEVEAVATIAKVQPSCFSVETDAGGWGSAVLISSGGHLLSAAHVYQREGQRVTLLRSGSAEIAARVVRMDRDLDIAILATEDSSALAGVAIPEFSGEMTESSFVVIALGHTSGFQKGRAAPVRLGMGIRETGKQQLLSTCRLSIGDSGGPLFNLEGELIGVHSTISRSNGFSSHSCVSSIKDLLVGLEATS